MNTLFSVTFNRTKYEEINIKSMKKKIYEQ